MYIQAPDDVRQATCPQRIFLAGGISNCPIWQDEVAKLIDTNKHDVINPRRKNDFESYGDIAAEQIAWEHYAFTVINACIFWFPSETLCPITLLEIGKQLSYIGQDNLVRPLIVGWHPEYKRAFDLQEQIKLEVQYNSNVRYNMLYYAPGWETFCNTIKYYYG